MLLKGQSSIPLTTLEGVPLTLFNPSTSVESKFPTYILVGAATVNYGSNFARWDAPKPFIASVIRPANNAPIYEIRNKNTYLANISGAISGPALQFQVPKIRSAVAIGYQSRIGVNYSSTASSVGTFMYRGIFYPPLQNVPLVNQNFNGKLFIGNEYFFNFSHLFQDFLQQRGKWGFTLKYLGSNAFTRINGENLDYTVRPSLSIPGKQDVRLELSEGTIFMSDADFEATIPWFITQSLRLNALGKGLALDLGISFENRPQANRHIKHTKYGNRINLKESPYAWKWGIGLADLGLIQYNGSNSIQAPISETNDFVPAETFLNVSTPRRFFAILENDIFDLNRNTFNSSYFFFYPTAFTFFADVRAKKNLYFGALSRINLLPRSIVLFREPSFISVIPRWEKDWLAFSLPLSLAHDFRLVQLGVGVRLGFLSLSANNLYNLISRNTRVGAAAQFSLQIPLNNLHFPKRSPLRCP